MKDMAFHIIDIVQNSIRAAATEITIALSCKGSMLTLRIADNGCGMDSATLARVVDPFYTTRTTRKVGLGIPFLIQNAQQSGGDATIVSQPNKGTTVTARFDEHNIDCPPRGDLAEAIMLCMTGNPQINTIVRFDNSTDHFAVSTRQIEEVLDSLPIAHPAASTMIKELLESNLDEIIPKHTIAPWQ